MAPILPDGTHTALINFGDGAPKHFLCVPFKLVILVQHILTISKDSSTTKTGDHFVAWRGNDFITHLVECLHSVHEVNDSRVGAKDAGKAIPKRQVEIVRRLKLAY